VRQSLFFLIAFFLGATAGADTAPQQVVPSSAGSPSRGQQQLGVKVFSDDVFDLSPKEPPPATSRGGRQVGDEGSYKQKDWERACASVKDRGDMQAYRDCYSNQKEKDEKALRQDFDRVEQRQNIPGGTNPLYEQQQRSNSLGD
jgi:hypothetical protein